ncbi:hypothetical protein TNCV_4793341 [Trichonephila clavipes]|nr:hypothetical protein TNCV_4793341 [Trichonephila clavipes]
MNKGLAVEEITTLLRELSDTESEGGCYKLNQVITIDEQQYPRKTQFKASKPDKYIQKFWIAADLEKSEELAVVVVSFVEGWMVLLEMAVEAVDGLGTCVFCVDVDVTFRGRPLFRSGATGEVSMSLKGVKAEVW